MFISDALKSARYAQDAVNEKIRLYSTASSISPVGVKPLRRSYSISEPIQDAANSGSSILECVPLETDKKGNFYDPSTGRIVVLKGINVDAQMKLPTEPYMPSYKGDSTNPDDIFFEGDTVSFVGRPFPLEEARSHFERIKSWGYNTIRYLLTWEAVEHEGPGKYDQKFADYTLEMLKIIGQVGGLYVFLEFHQDVWSRFSGGSGAPMWTFYAAGLDPKKFTLADSAIIHNEPRFRDGTDTYHKMLWTSNYKRLAPLVMFTMFFAGKYYFPNLIMNGENIQDFLQNHFLGAVEFIWKQVCEGVPELINNGTVLGFESMNEPNCGLIGYPDISQLPDFQQLRVGTTPTAFQSMRLGMGFACEVDEYRITVTGPRKYGTKIVDPKGTRAWLTPEDAKDIDKNYGFERGEKWELGTCIFATQGIWSWPSVARDMATMTREQRLDISSKCKVLEPHFFSKSLPQHKYESDVTKVDTHTFVNLHFVDHIVKFKKLIRKYRSDAFVMLSTPVLEEPPHLKNDKRNVIDDRIIYCPHYYDGLSLMHKSWNFKFNVDTLGIMRGAYLNPVLGIVFGGRAIRNCFQKQFCEMRRECNEYLGKLPILMSETGMPFDMDDKRSYRNGKYISQTAALDALCNALESANMSHTFWCYDSCNNHKYGDNWNNEDFSFWSSDDRNLTFEDECETPEIRNETVSERNRVKTARAIRKANRKLKRAAKMGRSGSVDSTASTTSATSGSSTDGYTDMESDSTSSSSVISSTSSNIYRRQYGKCYPSPDGVRAAGAVIRPYMMASLGTMVATEFDVKAVKLSLQIVVDKSDPRVENTPTIIFVPKWHFPFLDYGDVFLTSGYIKYNEELQYIEWYHCNDPSLNIKEESTTNEKTSTETIIIKNNSGSLEDAKTIEDRKLGCTIS
ncbi:Ergosteryl-beta-glucosidase [Candida parapsilosis]|nr:Ergosteryl-beta-glucosidase [Candida parapsilosis]